MCSDSNPWGMPVADTGSHRPPSRPIPITLFNRPRGRSVFEQCEGVSVRYTPRRAYAEIRSCGHFTRPSAIQPKRQVLTNDDARVRRNLERIRQAEVGDTKTVRAITSSALRGKLRLSGRDKRGRVFLPK